MAKIDYDLTWEGSCRLATVILMDNYQEYVKAIRYCKRTKKRAEKYLPIVQKWDAFQNLKAEVDIILKKNSLTDEDLEKVNEFSSMGKVERPKARYIEVLNKYWECQQEIVMCEQFLKSKRYQILTLGKGIPGKEVIEKVRREENYDG